MGLKKWFSETEKWRYKFRGLSVEENGRVLASLSSRKGVGDSLGFPLFDEKDIHDVYHAQGDTISDKGKDQLIKAFDAVRQYKRDHNIPLEVDSPSFE